MQKEYIFNPTSACVDERETGTGVYEYDIEPLPVSPFPYVEGETQRHNALGREEGRPGPSPAPQPSPTPDPSPGPEPTPDPSPDPSPDSSTWEYDGDQNSVPDVIDDIQDNQSWNII